jgi:hypothetical protein
LAPFALLLSTGGQIRLGVQKEEFYEAGGGKRIPLYRGVTMISMSTDEEK